MAEIALLRIEIDEVTPAVIRRVEVPITIRLDDLHFVLQLAVGWQNCHPFEFRAGATAWGLLDRDNPEASPLPADKATLADLLACANTFRYDYVYGEEWGHTVELEGLAAVVPDAAYPRLVSAEGRCPPADIGGPVGYETFLQAIADPEHLHHEGMIEWDDPDFDPNTVDEAAIRSNLANLGKYLGRRKGEAR
jgi:hypothetical protein